MNVSCFLSLSEEPNVPPFRKDFEPPSPAAFHSLGDSFVPTPTLMVNWFSMPSSHCCNTASRCPWGDLSSLSQTFVILSSPLVRVSPFETNPPRLAFLSRYVRPTRFLPRGLIHGELAQTLIASR